MNADAPTFVDSNVLVYAYDLSAGDKHVRARSICDELWRERRGVLSVQVLQEFFVTVTMKLPHPMLASDARAVVANLGRWRMHRPDTNDVVGAIDIHRRHRISFWDAMIIRSAQELECVMLLSEDLNDGQTYGTVRVIDPF